MTAPDPGDLVFGLIEANHDRLVGRPLVPHSGDPAARARWVYADAPFGLLAHDGGDDPQFVYANRTAQRSFEYAWREIVGLPSRLSTEPVNQHDRDELLAQVRRQGFAEGYRGLRISGSGRRFWIEDVLMWNLYDAAGDRVGQAARFDRTTEA